jgi:hypothetical protein
MYIILVGNLKGKDHSEALGGDGRMILKWILDKESQKLWTGVMWLRTGKSGGLL